MIIFFEGVGGSGKTTLAWYACKEWGADRLLQQFQLLIRVQLNDPRLQGLKNLELEDLIPDRNAVACKEYATAIKDVDGKGVCIFLEGLDETPKHLLEPLLSFITKICQKLHHLSFIMTTRPDVRILRSLHTVITSRILIKGFDKNRLGKFLDSSLGTDSDEREGLAHKFNISPQLEALSCLPINAVILSFLFKYFKDELPVTQTDLFNLLVCHACNRYLQLKKPELALCVSSLPHGLPSGLKESFQKLCSQAYKLLQENKRLFVGKFDDTLGLLQLRQNRSMYGFKEYYSFPHLSIQQFLAAVHLSQIDEMEQSIFVRKLLNQDPLNYVIPFFAGLTHLTNKVVLRILEKSLENVVTSQAILTQLESSDSSDPRRKVVALMNSLYECHDDKLTDTIAAVNENDPVCNEMFKKAGSSQTAPDLKVIILKSLPLTPRDCLSIGYFGRVKSKPGTHQIYKLLSLFIKLETTVTIMFDLTSCSLSDTGIEALTSELGKDIHSYTPVRIHLGLSRNRLNIKSLTCIKELVSEHHNVSVLSVPSCLHPQVVDLTVALKLLIEGVSRSVVNLLNLSENHLSVKHIHYFLLLLTACPWLSWLTMKSFPLSNPKVMKLFCGALSSRLSHIHTLDISSCGIDDTGLAILGKAVCTHKSLSHLRIFDNEFTSRGLTQFLRLFLKNSYSCMTFLGVILTTEHKRILDEINKFRTTKKLTNLKMSFEDVPHYQKASQQTRALNVHDQLRKHIMTTV